jgi:hypothetical protein
MRRYLAACLLLLLCPLAALAQPPAPIDATRDAFPGAWLTPGSARSAGLSLADRWFADEPYANPAMASGRAFSVSPIFQHVSRQDLRANNRDYTDQAGTFDFAGAWASWPLRGSLNVLAYVHEPALRYEDRAYSMGRGLVLGPAATLHSTSDVREIRTGAGPSFGVGSVRLGASLEWTSLSEAYTSHEESGSPNSGDESVDFSGSGVGGQFGAQMSLPMKSFPVQLGAGLRYLPELTLDGTQRLMLFSIDTTSSVSVIRSAAWEGGLSASALLGETFRVMSAFGGRGAQEWQGWGVSAGTTSQWSAAGEFHDAREAYTVRFGVGGESQPGTPEPRAGNYSAGFGWRFTRSMLDVGYLHRTIQRAGQPNSYLDQLLATLTFR